ncbi:MAG: ABC transporter ATP-binding protein [Christensenellaceae bacterium]|nr:ABC transporter ATP-binding protein [Christensenellaceae bacterium]
MVILNAKDVCKYFRGNKAVERVSLQVESGQIVGLIGANGAGKTTLFNCMTGYYSATSGSIEFMGQRIEKLAPHKICHLGVARTFQITKPFGDLSVLENVIVGAYNCCKTRQQAKARAEKYIKFVGLEDKRKMSAALLNTGEKRRLELARALATAPKLLLLDEVMAGLTPTESAEMVGLIRQIRDSGVTILMIEHIMPALMSLSDVVYVLDRGELIASGTPEEVSSNAQVIQSYLGKSSEA